MGCIMQVPRQEGCAYWLAAAARQTHTLDVRFKEYEMRTLLPLLSLLLTGCDTFYGVGRSAQYSEFQDLSCIESAIRSTPGVISVEHKHIPPQKAFTHKIITRPGFDQFIYHSTNAYGVVQVGSPDNPTNAIRVYAVWANRKPPMTVLTPTRSLMSAVCSNIAVRCSDFPRFDDLKETMNWKPKE